MFSTVGKRRGDVPLDHGGKKYYFKDREEARVGKLLHEHADQVITIYGGSPAQASGKEQEFAR
jgi:hypothetical protein